MYSLSVSGICTQNVHDMDVHILKQTVFNLLKKSFQARANFFFNVTMHSALKLEKKCNFKSAKKHYLHFQKWQKINFCTRKKCENWIFGSFKLFSGTKMDFLPFSKMQIMFFCTFEIAFFFQF